MMWSSRIGSDDDAHKPEHQRLGMQVVDYFAPYDQAYLDLADDDLGAGATLMLPPGAGIPVIRIHPAAGKTGQVYLLDRDNLGGFDPDGDVAALNSVVNSTGILTPPAQINGSFGTPIYYDGYIYFTTQGGPVVEFQLQPDGSLLQVGESTTGNGYIPGSAEISSDGTNNGILWVMDRRNQLTPRLRRHQPQRPVVDQQRLSTGRVDRGS